MTSSPAPRILAETFVRRVEWHAELTSTNDRALEIAAGEGASGGPVLIVADRQTRGRGRGENRWWANHGGLTCSLLAELPRDLPPQRSPLVALVTGLAVCETLRELLPGEPVGLKWPNDVWLRQRKVCGILIESPSGAARCAVIGVGLNVNNRWDQAPAEVQARAISLSEAAGGPLDRDEVLVQFLRHLARLWELLPAADYAWPERWQPYCVLSGRAVRIDQGPRSVVGLCQGIDADGALLLRSETGRLQRCVSGVVAEIADAPSPF